MAANPDDNISGNEEIDRQKQLEKNRKFVEDILGAKFLGRPVLTLRVHTTHIAVGKLDVEIGGTSAAWLYNMIALVLTEQLWSHRRAHQQHHCPPTCRLSGAVAAYSAGLIQVEVMGDQSDSEDYDSDEKVVLRMTGLCERFRPMEHRLGLFALPGQAAKIAIEAKVWKQNRFETKFEGKSMEMLPDLDSDAKWKRFRTARKSPRKKETSHR